MPSFAAVDLDTLKDVVSEVTGLKVTGIDVLGRGKNLDKYPRISPFIYLQTNFAE